MTAGDAGGRVYYNEIDPFAAAWLRELMKAGQIPDGEVDERSIELVSADDLRGFRQCHFFAGIGGWAYALKLAGWPADREVWTGSCPCQPFSSASNWRNQRTDDRKHLWPALRRLITANTPPVFLGEQIAQAGDWFAEVCADLEGLGYEIGAAILPAVAVGFDHARARLYFVGHANRHGESELTRNGSEVDRVPERDRYAGCLVPPYGVSRIMAGFGNAIVPQLAQVFIESYLECAGDAGGPP